MRIFIFNLFYVSIFLKFLFEYVCAFMHAHVCMCTCVYGYEFGRMERNKAFHQKASPSLYGTVLGYSTHPPKILASIICCQVYCLLLCSLPTTVAGEATWRKPWQDYVLSTKLWALSITYHSCALSWFTLLWHDPTRKSSNSWPRPTSPHLCILKDKIIESHLINMQIVTNIKLLYENRKPLMNVGDLN